MGLATILGFVASSASQARTGWLSPSAARLQSTWTSRLARPTSRLARRDARDCGALRCVLRGVARASARLRVRLFCGRVSGIDQRLARLFCGRVSVIEPRLARFFIKKQTTHKNASHPIRNIRVHTYLLQTLINIVTIFTDGLVIKNTRTAKTPTQNCQTLKHKAYIYIYIYIYSGCNNIKTTRGLRG